MDQIFPLFGVYFNIGDSPVDDIHVWTHELTEHFLDEEMKLSQSINISSIEDLLESKHHLKQNLFIVGCLPVSHLISPYGYNCLIGLKENGGE